MNVWSTGSWPVPIGDCSVQLPLVELCTLCGRVAPLNDQRTVCPVVTVTVSGDHVVAVPVTLIVAAGACAPATLAANRHQQTVLTAASSANVVRRIELPLYPLLPAQDASPGAPPKPTFG